MSPSKKKKKTSYLCYAGVSYLIRETLYRPVSSLYFMNIDEKKLLYKKRSPTIFVTEMAIKCKICLKMTNISAG